MAAMESVETCGNCGNKCEKPLRCGVCKVAVYCSANCQKEDWRFHKRNCKKPVVVEPRPTKPPPKSDLSSEADLEAEMAMKDPKIAAQVKQMMAGMGYGEDGKPVKEKETETKEAPVETCANCAQPCTKPLRCGQCKTATYCSAKCQKEDWQFHKRNCKKPAPETKTVTPSAPAASASSTAPAPGGEEASKPKSSDKMVLEGEDVGTWYNHRNWKPSEEKKDFHPEQIKQQAGSKAPETGSVWNAAGTWEEKAMLPWWEERLHRLKGLAVDSFAGKITIETVTIDPTSEAQIVHIRGTPRFLFDVRFVIDFSCKFPRSSRAYPGQVKVSEFSNETAAKEADFPVVVTAQSDSDKRAAEEKLIPAVQAALREYVAEYNTQVAAREGGAFPGQLPPSSVAATQAAA